MKNKFFALALVAFAAITFASCAKLEKVLVKKDGEWNIISFMMKQTMSGSTLMDTTIADFGTIMFKDDNTGTMTPNDTTNFGGPSTFTWSTNEDGDMLTIIDSGDTTEMEVSEMKAKSMTLHNHSTEDMGGGITVTSEMTMDLERK